MDKDLNDRLITVETVVKERNEVVKQHHQENRENFGKLFAKLDELPCNGHLGRIKGIGKDIKWIWRVISFFLAPATFGVLLWILRGVIK